MAEWYRQSKGLYVQNFAEAIIFFLFFRFGTQWEAHPHAFVIMIKRKIYNGKDIKLKSRELKITRIKLVKQQQNNNIKLFKSYSPMPTNFKLSNYTIIINLIGKLFFNVEKHQIIKELIFYLVSQFVFNDIQR